VVILTVLPLFVLEAAILYVCCIAVFLLLRGYVITYGYASWSCEARVCIHGDTATATYCVLLLLKQCRA
jgi:hypothetical protein